MILTMERVEKTGSMDPLTRELLFLVLDFLNEEKFKGTVHKLEQESGFYFNMKYFEDQVLAGEWDEVEQYLSGFTEVNDNRYSTKMFFEIRKQKYLETLDNQDRGKAVVILVKDLKEFSAYNEELYKEMTQLLTLDNFRENEQLSKYGDTKSARNIMLLELKKLIECNPLLRDKLEFLSLKASRLKTLLNQSLNWQHQLCENPQPNPDIKTRFVGHKCVLSNEARTPPPANSSLVSALSKGGRFATIGAHIPSQPVATYPSALAGWMGNSISLDPQTGVAAAPSPFVSQPHLAALLKYPRTPTINSNPGLDYQSADSEHFVKGIHPGQADEAYFHLHSKILTLERDEEARSMSSLTRKLVFLILGFLAEEKFKGTVHKLEQESGFYFNLKYFEDQVQAGEWDEVEQYLSGFTKVDDNQFSTKIFFEIRKQKYLEALDKQDREKAVGILVKDLKVFSYYNEEIYKDITQLLTLSNFRENEELSKYGDMKSARNILLLELKKLIECNPLLRDKLEFPSIKASWLRMLINQSLNWQHQLCKNPQPNPDIKTISNEAQTPPPGNSSLGGAHSKGGGFPAIGSHISFQPEATFPSTHAEWMMNSIPPVSLTAMAAAPSPLVSQPQPDALLKHPRAPPIYSNPGLDYQSAYSEHLVEGIDPGKDNEFPDMLSYETTVGGEFESYNNAKKEKEITGEDKMINDEESRKMFSLEETLITKVAQLSRELEEEAETNSKLGGNLKAPINNAKKEKEIAVEDKTINDEESRKMLSLEETLITKVAKLSWELEEEAETNSKLKKFLLDCGHTVAALQEEVSVLSDHVKLLKGQIDRGMAEITNGCLNINLASPPRCQDIDGYLTSSQGSIFRSFSSMAHGRNVDIGMSKFSTRSDSSNSQGTKSLSNLQGTESLQSSLFQTIDSEEMGYHTTPVETPVAGTDTECHELSPQSSNFYVEAEKQPVEIDFDDDEWQKLD